MRLEFSIYRYNPDVDDAPRMQDYTLEAEEGRDMMLLDALIQLKEKDPTQHAEIVAIREACKKLNTYDLSEYELYTSCEPCPMCLSAIIWANIKTVYYGCTKEDAGSIGFRDDKIYEFLKGENVDLIDLKQIDRKECFKEMENYKKNQGIIY